MVLCPLEKKYSIKSGFGEIESSIPTVEILRKLINLQEIYRNLSELTAEMDFLKKEFVSEEDHFLSKRNYYERYSLHFKKIEYEYEQVRDSVKEKKLKISEKEELKKKIKTIREFKAINKELEILVKEGVTQENFLLVKLEELEFKKQKSKKISSELEEMKNLLDSKRTDLENLQMEKSEKIELFTNKKKFVEKELPSKVSKSFERMYKSKEGVCITPLLRSGICCGCNMLIPLQKQIEVTRSEEIVLCTSCSRILYNQESILITEEIETKDTPD